MKRILFIILILLISISSNAQKGNNKIFANYEDTLKKLSYIIMNGQNDEEKGKANINFISNLNKVLEYEKSFKYPFDSLKVVSRIYSPDNNFRIFNWYIYNDNGDYIYYATIQHYNKYRKKYEFFNLTDNSENIRNPEQKDLNAENWYGCLYYDIIYIKKNGRKFYTLLGWDGNNDFSTKKIIDIMSFSNKEKVKFGLPIFKISKTESQKRIILEYDSRTSVSVKYHKKEKKIIFNNLTPQKKGLEGLKEYYVPEGSFNSYKYKKGKWWFEKDIDARNKIMDQQKKKKPSNGILPN